MELLKLTGLCVACLGPVLLLKRKTPELALALTAAVLAVTLARCLALLTPLLTRLNQLFRRAGLEEAYLGILFRAVAVGLVTKLGSDLCRDGGSQALASVVELGGAVAALLIAVPLLEEVVGLLLGFFG